MFYLASNYNSDAIFVFPGVDLYKRILISNQNSDLKISASSTYRIFLWSKNKVSTIFLASGKSMIKLFFLWSIWPVFSFNLAYCRPNSVNYVKLHNRSNTWQLLLIHPVPYVALFSFWDFLKLSKVYSWFIFPENEDFCVVCSVPRIILGRSISHPISLCETEEKTWLSPSSSLSSVSLEGKDGLRKLSTQCANWLKSSLNQPQWPD